MIDVVSIKFKNHGKSYYFDPAGLTIRTGDKVIVETSKGLEIADCFRATHAVEETSVVQPLRPVIRLATDDDLRVEAINKKCEKEAFGICEKKIAEHGLDMKLVDVECSFDGTKTTFFFTSDGRVDFRELVKDLASIFRNRIELRQIGVRDEAKMIGGLGICGRPYCCHQFLDDFQPVSTKMAKIQSLSLNPTKISGSCGRLMCCLRYEQEAYEDLIKRVPKQGAFVETKDGYGTAVQVNLLRQTVKVKLDKDQDDSLHLYNADEMAAVPGGRPRDGETPPHVYVPVVKEAEEEEESVVVRSEPAQSGTSEEMPRIDSNPNRKKNPRRPERETSHVRVEKKNPPATEPQGNARSEEDEAIELLEKDLSQGKSGEKRNHSGRNRRRSNRGGHGGAKPNTGSEEAKPQNAKKQNEQKPVHVTPKAAGEGETPAPKKKNNSGRRYYRNRKPKQQNPQSGT